MSKPLEPAQATSRTGPDGQPIKCEETAADEGARADRPVLDDTVMDPEGGPQPDEAATIDGIADPMATTTSDSEQSEFVATDCETVTSARGDGAMAAYFTRDQLSARVTTVAGYEILGELGRGSMGVVYQARQRGLTRVVALKMILAGAHCRPDELARFRNEAVAVAELQHPNIVQLYEVGEDGGQPFFSLEYVDGPSLAKKINGMPQPPAEAARLTRLLAQGMEAAHRRGIVHRDLKPANVLLTSQGEPKISDFGLVKRLEDDAGNTQSGSILGTPSYMAPEQAEGRIEEIGPRADIYAIGAILYELLTGRPPFRAASVLDTLELVRTQEPIAPSQFQPKIPRDLETICLKCLQKEIGKRYATAAELGEDLRRFEFGEPIAARPVGRAERLWRWCRRNRKIAALCGALGVLLIAWSVTSTLLYRLARSNERDALGYARQASDNEADARRNADSARKSEERAKASAALASRRADTSLAIASDSISNMVRLGDHVLRRIQARQQPARADAEWLRLRTDLIGLLSKEIVPMAERIEGQDVTAFAVLAAHQQLGDLLKKFGLGEAARQHYKRGFDAGNRVVSDHPDNDQARANLGVILVRLGDTALDLDGDAGHSRDQYKKAWDLQHEISLHPHGARFTAADNHRILSGVEIKLGLAELSLAHPALAREWTDRALADRTAWTDLEPNNISTRSYLSEAELWQGVVMAHLDEWPGARVHFDRAVEICEELTARFPRSAGFKADLATVNGELGEALLRLGKDDEAEKLIRQSTHDLEAAGARNSDDTAQRALSAMAFERLGFVARGRGQRDQETQAFQAALVIRTELASVDPDGLPRQVALALALARSGRRDDATRRAADLVQTAGDRTALLLSLARTFAACAFGEADAERRNQDRARTLEVLESALRNGYRDPQALRTDPDFASCRAEPPFQSLLARLEPKAK